MRLQLIRMGSGFATLALFAGAPAMAMDADTLPPSTADAMAQAASPQAIAEYRRKLREYQEARAAFEEQAGAYGSSISEKRKGRNAKRRERQAIALNDYVLTQPPDRVSYRSLTPLDAEMQQIADMGLAAGILERRLDVTGLVDRRFIPEHIEAARIELPAASAPAP